jgi:hypothetical protein
VGATGRLLLQECDEIGELLVFELLAVVAGHDVRLEPLGDLGVRVHDRRADELGVLALERLVEVRAGLPGRAGRLVGVAAPAVQPFVDRCAGLGVPLRKRLLRNLALDRLRQGLDCLAAPAARRRDRDREQGQQRDEREEATHGPRVYPADTR